MRVLHFAVILGLLWLIHVVLPHTVASEDTAGIRLKTQDIQPETPPEILHIKTLPETPPETFHPETLRGRKISKNAWSEEAKESSSDEQQDSSGHTEADAGHGWGLRRFLRHLVSMLHLRGKDDESVLLKKNSSKKDVPPGSKLSKSNSNGKNGSGETSTSRSSLHPTRERGESSNKMSGPVGRSILTSRRGKNFADTRIDGKPEVLNASPSEALTSKPKFPSNMTGNTNKIPSGNHGEISYSTYATTEKPKHTLKSSVDGRVAEQRYLKNAVTAADKNKASEIKKNRKTEQAETFSKPFTYNTGYRREMGRVMNDRLPVKTISKTEKNSHTQTNNTFMIDAQTNDKARNVQKSSKSDTLPQTYFQVSKFESSFEDSDESSALRQPNSEDAEIRVIPETFIRKNRDSTEIRSAEDDYSSSSEEIDESSDSSETSDESNDVLNTDDVIELQFSSVPKSRILNQNSSKKTFETHSTIENAKPKNPSTLTETEPTLRFKPDSAIPFENSKIPVGKQPQLPSNTNATNTAIKLQIANNNFADGVKYYTLTPQSKSKYFISDFKETSKPLSQNKMLKSIAEDHTSKPLSNTKNFRTVSDGGTISKNGRFRTTSKRNILKPLPDNEKYRAIFKTGTIEPVPENKRVKSEPRNGIIETLSQKEKSIRVFEADKMKSSPREEKFKLVSEDAILKPLSKNDKFRIISEADRQKKTSTNKKTRPLSKDDTLKALSSKEKSRAESEDTFKPSPKNEKFRMNSKDASSKPHFHRSETNFSVDRSKMESKHQLNKPLLSENSVKTGIDMEATHSKTPQHILESAFSRDKIERAQTFDTILEYLYENSNSSVVQALKETRHV